MIRIEHVHKRLGDFAVHDVTLNIAEREYFILLGPTGAGKTVLLECVAGLHPLDRGRVFIKGQDVSDWPAEWRKVSYVPQDYVLFPHLTVRENIAFSLRLQRWPRRQVEERVTELAEMLGIAGLLDRGPRTLSGGEQQRTAIARALAPRPTALLLDEPLSALDENTRAQIALELEALPEKFGTTVIHVCHNFEEALRLGTCVAILHQGRLVQVGTPEDVFNHPNCRFVAEFMRVRNIFPLAELRGDGQVVRVRLASGIELQAPRPPELPDRALVTVRPESIKLLAEAPAEPNALPVTVGSLRRLAGTTEVELVADGLRLSARLTQQACQGLRLAPGEKLWAVAPPQALHLLPDRFLPEEPAVGEAGDATGG